MMLHNYVRSMNPGEQIKIIATDPSTQRDIPKFCQFLGHRLEKCTVENGDGVSGETVFVYWMTKCG